MQPITALRPISKPQTHATGHSRSRRSAQHPLHPRKFPGAPRARSRALGGPGKWANRTCTICQFGFSPTRRNPDHAAIFATASAKSLRTSTRKAIASSASTASASSSAAAVGRPTCSSAQARIVSDRLKTQLNYVPDLNPQQPFASKARSRSDRILQSRRRARYPRHGRMDLLRLLAEMDGLEAKRYRNRRRQRTLANRAPAFAPQHARVALRQRQRSPRPPPSSAPSSPRSRNLADWPNPVLPSASKHWPLTGRTGVKMRGPYDYTPSDYWSRTPPNSEARGFATEIGSGAAIPLQSSLEKMLPADHIKPGDPVWNFLYCRMKNASATCSISTTP